MDNQNEEMNEISMVSESPPETLNVGRAELDVIDYYEDALTTDSPSTDKMRTAKISPSTSTSIERGIS